MDNKGHIHVLARAVIIQNNYILLAYDPRFKPYHYYDLDTFFYYLPGGHIEFNEPAKTTIIREIKEETGYNCEVERFMGLLENSWLPQKEGLYCHTHEINLIFKVNIPEIDTNINIEPIEEHVAFKWERLDRLSQVDFRPKNLVNILPAWLKEDFNQSFESII